MAVKSSGSLSFNTDIVGEFGGQAPHSLSAEYYRGSSLVPDASANSDIPNAVNTEISFSDFYGSVSELGVTITSGQNSLNLLSAIESVHGTQSSAGSYRITIPSNVTIGAASNSPNNAACSFGNFPDGSTITLVVNGQIRGLAGVGGTGGAGATGHSTAPAGTAGGAGGDAIYADYANQTMYIENNGYIQAGGGGSGGGGGGGKGGDGRTSSTGAGPYTPYQYSLPSPAYYVSNDQGYAGDKIYPARPQETDWYWNGSLVGSSPYNDTYHTFGSYNYSRGPFQTNLTVAGTQALYSIRRRQASVTTYTYYDGGNGGAGGNGQPGVGSNTNTPSEYWGSNSGSSGSTGPGPAGNGGAGGASGAIGGYGVAGTAGSPGSSGSAGNYPPGASSGGSGGAGGAAGRYLVKGSQTVTVTGSGTTAGGTA